MEFSKEIPTDSKCSLVSTEKRKKSDGFEGRTELFLRIRFRLEVNSHYYRFSTETSLKCLTLLLNFQSNNLLTSNFLVSEPMIMKMEMMMRKIYQELSLVEEHQHGSLYTNFCTAFNLRISADKSKYDEERCPQSMQIAMEHFCPQFYLILLVRNSYLILLLKDKTGFLFECCSILI